MQRQRGTASLCVEIVIVFSRDEDPRMLRRFEDRITCLNVMNSLFCQLQIRWRSTRCKVPTD